MRPAAKSPVPAAERRLLAACLLVGEAGRGLAQLAAADLDWRAFLDLAERQMIAETACHSLQEEEATSSVPPAVLAALREAHEGSAAQNALLLHDLARIQALLDEAGVPSAALKGTALVAAHYPSIAARHVGDIDLLVRPEHLETAAVALARAGLRRPEPTLPPNDGSAGSLLARNPAEDHLLPLATWSGSLLELHDRPPGGGPAAEEILARSRRVDWQGRPLRIPSPVDLAGMACVHAMAKHGADWRIRARHVADLHVLLATGPFDWSEVRARYGAGHGQRAIEASLALLEAARREATGAGPSPRSLGLLEPPPASRSAAGRVREVGDELSAAWRTAGPAAALRSLFPARRYMEARFGLRPGSPWVPLLYPWRLARGAVRRLLGR